jgi:hypothetical protein
MHGMHAAVMDGGVSDRRLPIQTAPIDVFSQADGIDAHKGCFLYNLFNSDSIHIGTASE